MKTAAELTKRQLHDQLSYGARELRKLSAEQADWADFFALREVTEVYVSELRSRNYTKTDERAVDRYFDAVFATNKKLDAAAA